MSVIDLNADVGEWEANGGRGDADLMPFITSANIACGVHAGNAEVMAETVALAILHDVAIGAHPSLDDRDHFGRRELPVTAAEVKRLVKAQVIHLSEIAGRAGARLRHVKPHGALYNMASRDRHLATAIAESVIELDASLTLIGLSGSELIAAGKNAGLTTASEAFADRMYLANGALAPRSINGSVLDDPDAVAEQAVLLARDGRVTASDGAIVELTVETICIHGDTPGAASLARQVRAALEAAGISISARR
jgi:5-oxoprolinase (ATP-hydrolysing) subunit A